MLDSGGQNFRRITYCKSTISLLMTSGQDIPAPGPRAVMGQHEYQLGIRDQSQRLRSWELTRVIKRTNRICFSGDSSTGAGTQYSSVDLSIVPTDTVLVPARITTRDIIPVGRNQYVFLLPIECRSRDLLEFARCCLQSQNAMASTSTGQRAVMAVAEEPGQHLNRSCL